MKTKSVIPPEPKVSRIETFRDPRGYWLDSLTINGTEPSCFNGGANYERWEVTVVKIEEPDDVICARLEKLWRESDNYHDRGPLKRAAEKYGYAFTGRFGEDQGGRKKS